MGSLPFETRCGEISQRNSPGCNQSLGIWHWWVPLPSLQRHKESKLSGWQDFMRKNFPDGVRKSFQQHMCQKCVKRFRAKTLLTKVQDMEVATILPTIKYLSRKFPDCSESFQTLWKVSRQSGNFLYCPETFYTVRKLPTLSRKFPDYLETFRTNYKLSSPSGNFPDRLETFRIVRKLSRHSGNFPHSFIL